MALFLDLKVIPSSGRQAFSLKNQLLKCYLKAAPEKGKANKELIAVLSKKLKIPKAAITITSGEAARNKRVRIEGEDDEHSVFVKLGLEVQRNLLKEK
jgi:uncharacterized protein